MEQTTFSKTIERISKPIIRWCTEYKRTKRTAILIFSDGKEYYIRTNLTRNGELQLEQYRNLVVTLESEPEFREMLKRAIRTAERLATNRRTNGVKS